MTTKTMNFEQKFQYVESQLNKLVRNTDKPYQFTLIDYYGNKTNYFSITAEQFEKIGAILKGTM